MNCKKVQLEQNIIGAGVLLQDVDISDESKIRVVVENASGANTVIVKAKILGQSSYTTLATITGTGNQLVSVNTYDLVIIDCTSYGSSSNYVKVIASSFNEASGAAIDSIGVTAGDNLTDFESFSFTSSDASIIAEGNNTTKEIDLKVSPSFGGTYSNSFLVADWGLSGSNYIITIPAGVHGKGTEPKCKIYEKNGTDYIETTLEVKTSSVGLVTLSTLSSPDLRFDGKILIF